MASMQSIVRSVFCSWVLALAVTSAQAEGDGILNGRVVDASTSEPVVGANVTIVGTARGASTDFDGHFEIRALPAGTYAIRVSSVGYEAIVRTDIVVSAARPTQLTIPLQQSPIEVEGVSVSATYFQKLADKPVSTLTQSREEIRRIPGGFEDVVRAISILPGVAQVQAGRNDLIVRGGAPSENLYVIENIEVPNINHFGTQGASGGPLSFVNLDFVRRTTFSTGGFGSRYGDKLSSVLSIDLREGRTDRIGGKATISASQFGLDVEGPATENGTFVVSARRSYLDFIFKAAGFGFVPEYWDVLGIGTYRLTPKDNITVFGVGALDYVTFFNETEEQRFDNARILGSDQQQLIGGATWKHVFTAGYVAASLSRVDVDYDYRQSDSLLNPLFQSTSREAETGMRADLVILPMQGAEVSLGVQRKSVSFRNHVIIPDFRTSFGDTVRVNTRSSTVGWKDAVYAQWLHTYGHTRVTVGMRGDVFDLIDAPMRFSPRLSVSRQITPTMSISAAAGIYRQSPAYVWLSAVPENRSLEPSKVTQYIVGADYNVREDTRISLEAYVKRYELYPASLVRPYLVMANTGAGFGGTEEGFASFGFERLASVGTGLSRGVELLLQKKLSEIPCYGTLSISYGTSEFKALDGVSRPGAFDQRWLLNVGGGYILNEHWEFGLKFRFATGRPYTPFGPNGEQSAAQLYSERVDVNHSLDIRVDRRWQFDAWTLITYLDVQNVYNRKPKDVPRYDPRTGGIAESQAIGLLPSIGVSAEF